MANTTGQIPCQLDTSNPGHQSGCPDKEGRESGRGEVRREEKEGGKEREGGGKEGRKREIGRGEVGRGGEGGREGE